MKKIKLAAVFIFLLVSLIFISCEGARLRIHEAPLYGPGSPQARQSELLPGQGEARPGFEMQVNEEILIEGKRLYGWYNCAGCHFNGGGGIGPAFMDNQWIYGSEPNNIADSIINGRPQGMPAYGGRIPAAHLGPIVAYVRALSGLGDAAAPTPTPLPKFKDKDKPIEELQKELPGVKQQQQQQP